MQSIPVGVVLELRVRKEAKVKSKNYKVLKSYPLCNLIGEWKQDVA